MGADPTTLSSPARPSGRARCRARRWTPDTRMRDLFPEYHPQGCRTAYLDSISFGSPPPALHPIPPEWIGAGAEEYLGERGNVIPVWRDPFLPYMSITKLFPGDMPA